MRCNSYVSYLMLLVISFFVVFAQGADVKASESMKISAGEEIGQYDILEISVAIEKPNLKNPFLKAKDGGADLAGIFKSPAGNSISVNGYSDSKDGSLFKIRFVPEEAGKYTYNVKYKDQKNSYTGEGSFNSVKGTGKGFVRPDKKYNKFFSLSNGEVKIYMDGDSVLPSLCGTGTEDYIGTGWGQSQYSHLYQGCPLADGDNLRYGFYRFHVPDPVLFSMDLRVTIQQIGAWSPETKPRLNAAATKIVKAGNSEAPVDFGDPTLPAYGLFERQDDFSSCAYFYLNTV